MTIGVIMIVIIIIHGRNIISQVLFLVVGCQGKKLPYQTQQGSVASSGSPLFLVRP